MKFVLVDRFAADGVVREHAGSFGAAMSSPGAAGRLVQWLKQNLVNLPVVSFGFAASQLREAGHEVAFSPGEVAEADVVVVASSMHSHREEAALCADLKERLPGARVGFYGMFSSLKPELFPQADFIVQGELEPAVAEFLSGGHDFSGRVGAARLDDLSILPAADWRGMDVRRFSYFPLLHRRPTLPVQSSRGCSHCCGYCSYMPMQGRAHRRRTPEAVVREMAQGVERHGARSFLFRDICFTLNRGHAMDMARGLRRAGLGVEWACETRVDCLDEALIDAMVAAGFRGVNLGIESPDADILAKAGKRSPELERQKHILGVLADRGVRVNAFYILGLPGDTPDTMRRTIAYARELNTLGAQFCVLTPFPGTALFEEYADRLLTDDFARFTEYAPVVDIGSSSPQEVSRALSEAYRYYFNRAWFSRHGLSTLGRAAVNVLGRWAPGAGG